MKKLLSVLLALALLMSLGAAALASGEASGDPSAAPEDTGPKAALVYGDEGEDRDNEQTEGFALDLFPGGGLDESGLRGFTFTSDRSGAALFYAEPRENPLVFTIGGDGANVPLESVEVSETAADFLRDLGVDAFDSAILLGDDQKADVCPPVISAKGLTDLTIQGTVLLADGAGRSAFYADVSGGSTIPGPGSGGAQGSEEPVVRVFNSLLETTGSGDVAGEIAVGQAGGRARGIQPQGKSVTYLYNSAIVSRTWGAWSTDSARQRLDLVAWRSLGLSQGGYGAYADTSCRLFLYGSTVMGSSDGIVASNDGEIYAVNSDCRENSTELRAHMQKTGAPRDLSWQDDAAPLDEVRDSVIMGGQTAVQFHMPDLGRSGAGNKRAATLYMEGGSLVTDPGLIKDGFENLAAYNQTYAGALLVTKSTQANILLRGTEMDSWSGELIHTMINSDSNVNNIADGDTALGSDITFQDMNVAGDIVNDDYQRELRLTLDNTVLTGAIYSNTWEDWNARCEQFFDGQYILDPDGYTTRWGVVLTLSGSSVWNVTAPSVVADLIINDGAAVNGVITENDDGTLTVSPLASGEAS